jgi:hypothetical protein
VEKPHETWTVRKQKQNVDMASECERNVECDGDVPTSMSDYCDSVRGVDSGVGDCREAVIKKAIAL